MSLASSCKLGDPLRRRTGRCCGRISSPANKKSLERSLSRVKLVVAAIGVGLLLRKARLHSRMWLPLVSSALIYCVINPQLLGSTGADRRLIPALFLVLACSLEWNVRERCFVAVIGLVFLVRTVVVIKNWSAANAIYSA